MKCKILSKLGMIPAMATFCLIWFISYEFVFEYMFIEFQETLINALLVVFVFLYLSI